MIYNYGDAYLKYPLSSEPYIFPNGSTVQVHDIMDCLPEFMKAADLIFVDPPWNKGNLHSFYTKADIDREVEYDDFYERLFKCIAEISPKTCYIEVGKEYLADFIIRMRRHYKHVTFYNSTYYHKKENKCYIVRGSHKYLPKPKLDDIDEEDIIKWICENEEYTTIGDLCMGRGLVGFYANQVGRRFVGTELNAKRLSVLLKRIDTGRI